VIDGHLGIVSECLGPAVPTSKKELEDYNLIIEVKEKPLPEADS
jgi:hypothetical protein